MDQVRIMLGRFVDQSASTALRADAVNILSRLCANHTVNQATFRQNNGIVALVGAVELYCRGRQPAPRTKKNALPHGAFGMSGSASEKISPMIVGVVGCLWNAVVRNAKSEARFLSLGGIDELLNMLEVCPVLMRHQIVGVITDMCENKHIIPYVKVRSARLTRTTPG